MFNKNQKELILLPTEISRKSDAFRIRGWENQNIRL